MQQQRYSVGEYMRWLLSMVAAKPAESMKNQVEFLSSWGQREDTPRGPTEGESE